MRRASPPASSEASAWATQLCERLYELWWLLPAYYKRELYREFGMAIARDGTPLLYPLQLAILRNAFLLRTCVIFELQRVHVKAENPQEAYYALARKWLRVPTHANGGELCALLLGMALPPDKWTCWWEVNADYATLPRLLWYSPEFCDYLALYCASSIVDRRQARN